MLSIRISMALSAFSKYWRFSCMKLVCEIFCGGNSTRSIVYSGIAKDSSFRRREFKSFEGRQVKIEADSSKKILSTSLSTPI